MATRRRQAFASISKVSGLYIHGETHVLHGIYCTKLPPLHASQASDSQVAPHHANHLPRQSRYTSPPAQNPDHHLQVPNPPLCLSTRH